MFRILVLFLACISLSFSDESVFEDDFASEYASPKQRFDPLSGYNRAMTSFNDFTYMHVIDPAARGYKSVVADDIRFVVGNFFDNLLAPMRFANNLLQGKIKNSGDELFRFVVNTTMGVGGFGDAGKEVFGIQRHPEDFGQTLGFYGVGSGFPIVLPIFGPSNVRDSIGLVGDYFANPINYLDNQNVAIGLNAYNKLNYVSLHVDDYGTIKKDAIDLYPYLQDLYEEHRKNQIEQ